MVDCVFCKIVNKELQSNLIYEDSTCFVILDKFPITKGQGLVIAKKHVDYLMDLDDETYSHMFMIAKKIAKAMDKALETKKTCMVVEGFDVAHNHIKLFPAYEGQHLNFSNGLGSESSDKELYKLADKIKSFLK